MCLGHSPASSPSGVASATCVHAARAVSLLGPPSPSPHPRAHPHAKPHHPHPPSPSPPRHAHAHARAPQVAVQACSSGGPDLVGANFGNTHNKSRVAGGSHTGRVGIRVGYNVSCVILHMEHKNRVLRSIHTRALPAALAARRAQLPMYRIGHPCVNQYLKVKLSLNVSRGNAVAWACHVRIWPTLPICPHPGVLYHRRPGVDTAARGGSRMHCCVPAHQHMEQSCASTRRTESFVCA